MENTLQKNYTLITGAGSGIGKQIAIECAKKGFNLFLVSLPDTNFEKLAEELRREYPVDIQMLSLDLTNYEAPQMVFDFAREKCMKINILVNNAGVGFNGKFETLTSKLIDTMILLNVRAATLLSFFFLPEMKLMDKAYILNISSFGGLTPLPYKCVYGATKTYLLFLTQALNSELEGSNISVTSVHPSGVSSERAMDNIRKSSFIARLSTLRPEEVAQIALKNMFAGNQFVVPGMVTKFYYMLGLMLPYGIVLRVVGRVFRKTT